VVPCILITLLSVGTFIIPVASNQKIHLAISVFMGLTVYLSMLARLTPETESLPLLSRFLMVSLMSVSLSILASAGDLDSRAFVYHHFYIFSNADL